MDHETPTSIPMTIDRAWLITRKEDHWHDWHVAARTDDLRAMDKHMGAMRMIQEVLRTFPASRS